MGKGVGKAVENHQPAPRPGAQGAYASWVSPMCVEEKRRHKYQPVRNNQHSFGMVSMSGVELTRLRL